MSKSKDVNPTYFEQSDIAAFIYHVLKLPPTPKLRSDGKVVFRFDQDVTDALQRFYNDEQVPVSSFCQKQKTIRSMIFSMKGGHGYGKKA
jgi:hypothetical protein